MGPLIRNEVKWIDWETGVDEIAVELCLCQDAYAQRPEREREDTAEKLFDA